MTFGKKRRAFFWIALCALVSVFLYFLPSPAPVRASAESDRSADEIKEQFDGLLDALDTEELQNYLDGLQEFGGISVKDKIKGLLSGDMSLDYPSLLQACFALVFDEGKAFLPAFAVILAVALLIGILNSVKNSFLQSTTSDIINFVAYISVGAAVLSCLIGVLKTGFGAIRAMQKQMELVYPILLTLMAASGGAVSVGVYRPAVAFMSGTICKLFTAVVLPVAIIVIVLAFVGNLTEDVRTDRLGDLFKSVSKWLIGLTLGLFGLFLTVQGMTSAQYDGLSLRAMKYVVSGSVPIVGGFLSGGLDVVVAGSALIKNAVGSFALFLLAGTLLRPLLLFAAFQLFLRISAAATEPVGGKISPFLSKLAADSGYFLAGLLCVAFLYFLTLVLLICSSGVIL